MKKRMAIILMLCFSAGYGTVTLVRHYASPAVVEISEGEVTINDPSDVKEYIIGLKQ